MGTRRKYTYELLAEAAAHSTSVPEVLRYLGVPTGGSLHSHIGRRMRDLGVDTSHFTGGRRYTVEVLTEAVARSTSVAGVLRYLGRTQAGGTHAHVSRAIRRYGLDTTHFQRYPGPKKSVNRLSAEQILVCDPASMKRRDPMRLRRALVEIGRLYACERCGCDGRWQGESITLHVDHISGDFRDNTAGNLRFLCPTCHALTPNFAGRANALRRRDGRVEGVDSSEDSA